MSEHRCFAIGCTKVIDASLLMCARHWKMVPKPIQREVWRAYHARKAAAVFKGGVGPITAQYTAAVLKAQDAVSDRIVDVVMRDLPEEAR